MTGFVSIDSAPLQRSYVTAVELWLLKRMEPVYVHYPWKWLLKSGSEGVATSDYGRNLMREMMLTYDGNQKRYAQIAGHGFRILAAAMDLKRSACIIDMRHTGSRLSGKALQYENSFDVDRRSRTQFQYRQTRTGESFDRGICC